MTVIAATFLFGGAVFLMVSCVGLLRLPDFYTRAHAVGKAETLGSMLILIGLALYNGPTLSSVKLLLIFLIIAVIKNRQHKKARQDKHFEYRNKEK